MSTSKKKNSILSGAPLIIFLAYGIYTLIFHSFGFNLCNYLIFFFSIILVFTGLRHVLNEGVRLSNIFLIVFFAGLAMNNLNISKLQVEKEFKDIYYYFFGPLLFYSILRFGETRLPRKHIRIKKCLFSPELIGTVILLLFLAIKIYILRIRGIQFFVQGWQPSQRDDYTISGLSGLSRLIMWLLLMLIPMFSRRLKVATVASVLVSAVFDIARGDMMRICLYLLMMWASGSGRRFFTRKNVIRFAVFLFVLLIAFSLFGNYREALRNTTTTMQEQLKSHTNNNLINWTYSYTAFNYDVLKQIYIDGKSTGEIRSIFLPITYLLFGYEAIAEYNESVFTTGVNWLNASTFLGKLILELGVFYFINTILLGLIVMLLDWSCDLIGFRGGKFFLLMLTTLTLFGNYFVTPDLFWSLIGGELIHFFVFDSRTVNVQIRKGSFI